MSKRNQAPRDHAASRYQWLLIVVAFGLTWSGSDLLGQDSPPQTTVDFVELLAQAPLVDVPTNLQEADPTIVKLNVSGRILDETGQSIADSVVILRDWFGVIARTRGDAKGDYRFENIRSASRSHLRTDNDGSITIADVVAADSTGRMNWKPIKYFASGSSTRQRYDPRSLPDSFNEQVDVTLAAPRALTGVILNSDDRPVPDVQVRIDALIEFDSRSLVRDIPIVNVGKFQTASDGEGQFSFPHVPPGLFAFLELTHPDFFPTRALIRTSPNAVEPPPNFVGPAPIQDSPAQLHLTEKVFVRGEIVNRHGDRLEGAVIRSLGVSKTESSDESGNFSIGISANWLKKQVDEPMVAPLTVQWPEGSPYVESRPEVSRQRIVDHERVRIVAEEVVELHGRVIGTTDHQPVAHLPLNVEPVTPSRFLPTKQLQTDGDGRFTVNLQEGRWVVTCGPMAGFDLFGGIAGPDYPDAINPQSQRVIDLFEGQEPSDLVIGIDRIPDVAVHVVDSTGEPVAGAKVRFMREPQRTYMTRSQRQYVIPIPEGITDEKGNCEFQLPTLFNENWTATARSPAETPQLFAARELRTSRDQKIELKLDPGFPVHGRVLLNGDPLANAKVSLMQFSSTGKGKFTQTISTVTTDAAGTYEMFIPTQREWALNGGNGQFEVKLVELPAFTQCSVSSQVALRGRFSGVARLQETPLDDIHVDFALGKASGVIVDEHDHPVVGAVIRANPDRVLVGDPAAQATATTDKNGAFEWIGLGPGKFQPVVVIDGVENTPHVTIEAGQNAIKIIMPLRR